uniref:Uncharacterized protein n=1 Tax=Anguilla anguilla TaxID=7936 RepID=A0A0E9W2H9_ANGAN
MGGVTATLDHVNMHRTQQPIKKSHLRTLSANHYQWSGGL